MKSLKYFVLFFFVAVWILALTSYETVYPYLYRWGIIEDEYRYGDLFKLSYLPQFKQEMVKCEAPLAISKSSSKPIHLFVVGDSFLEPQRIDSADFIADRYHYIKWGDYLHIRLDTTATNVVLLESVERHFREHFERPASSFFIPDTATFAKKGTEKRWMARLDDFLKSDRAEGQLGLLFSSNTAGIKFKEFRSNLNYRLFNRSETGVTVSQDGKHVVYYMDTDTVNYPHTSGFSEITTTRIDSIVNTLNKTRSHLLEMGFDHVLFAVIPNKSTIVMPDYGRYNHLIERVEQHPQLAVPNISIISEYRAMGAGAYLLSDSHWTCEGRSVWLNKANNEFNRLIATDTTGSYLPSGQACMTPGSVRSLIQKK